VLPGICSHSPKPKYFGPVQSTARPVLFAGSFRSRGAPYTQGSHETAYLLVKGKPPKPTHPIRDVLDREYTGNKFHPHEKPISAMTALITAFSKPGAIVLDPFAGSATTGIAALDCGRRFIMIEKMPRHYRVARSRLNFAKFVIGKPISPCPTKCRPRFQ
jgi:DNA modification methylase